MAYANGVITLGESEVRAQHGHTAPTQKGDSDFLQLEAVEHSLIVEVRLDHY